MQKRPPGSTKSARRANISNPHPDPNSSSGVSVAELLRRVPEFLYECEYRGHSPRTLTEERSVLEKLLRYLDETGGTLCGGAEIRQYLTHVAQGGMQGGGRWGQQEARPVRPRTVRNHWSYLRTFFNWLIEEDPNLPHL